MSFLLFIALAAVSGDFDGDGRADRAYIRTSGDVSELVVKRATGQIVVVDVVASPASFYFGKSRPGNYRTACGKGLGRISPCAVPILSVRGDALQFGSREASQAVAVWAGDHFQVHWLSD